MTNKFICALFLLCFLPTSTGFAWFQYGDWWTQRVNIRVEQTIILASIPNERSRRISCQGTLHGRTVRGNVIDRRVSGRVMSGQSLVFEIHTTHNNPFVDGRANIRCR